MDQNNAFDMTLPAAVFLYAPLEHYSPELTGLIVELWRELDDPDEPEPPASLAIWISGVAAGLSYSHPAYGQVICKSAAIADLEALESVLIMRGRLSR